MKKAALLCALLGAIFISGCAKQESATTETTESTTTAPADEAGVDTDTAVDATAPAADAAATTSTAM